MVEARSLGPSRTREGLQRCRQRNLRDRQSQTPQEALLPQLVGGWLWHLQLTSAPTNHFPIARCHFHPIAFSQVLGGPCGIRGHETDWLAPQNALVRASSPRRKIERQAKTTSSPCSVVLGRFRVPVGAFSFRSRVVTLFRRLRTITQAAFFAASSRSQRR